MQKSPSSKFFRKSISLCVSNLNFHCWSENILINLLDNLTSSNFYYLPTTFELKYHWTTLHLWFFLLIAVAAAFGMLLSFAFSWCYLLRQRTRRVSNSNRCLHHPSIWSGFNLAWHFQITCLFGAKASWWLVTCLSSGQWNDVTIRHPDVVTDVR